MPIFPTPKPLGSPSDVDRRHAETLAKVIRERKRRGGISINGWSKHFQKLRTLDHVTEQDISTVLNWYVQHFGERFVPEAFSAKSFRAKFLAIEKAMERERDSRVGPISKKAVKIMERLSRLHWPKNDRNAVLNEVQRSLDRYTPFYKKLLDATQESTPIKIRNLSRFLISKIGSASTFIEQWWRSANASVQGWVDWSGDLRSLSFRLDHPRFVAMMNEYVMAYCQDASRWNILQEYLSNED